jgi:hypothetical protein
VPWLVMASISHWGTGTTHSRVWPMLQCSDWQVRLRAAAQVGMEHMSSRRAGRNSSGCTVNTTPTRIVDRVRPLLQAGGHGGEVADLADEAPGVLLPCAGSCCSAGGAGNGTLQAISLSAD